MVTVMYLQMLNVQYCFVFYSSCIIPPQKLYTKERNDGQGKINHNKPH